MGAVSRLAKDVPPPDPNAPGVFRLAAPGALAGHFTAAGARDVREERRAFVMEGALALDEFWPFVLRLAAPLRAVVTAQTPDVQGAIAAAVRADVARYFHEGTMRFPAEMVVARAVSPTRP
jgi:hypothetical protein